MAERRNDEAVAEFIEEFAAALMRGGMPRMPARVFGALLTTDTGRLTAPELADLLHVSAAAVSGAVRYLTQVNMIRRERDPQSRRELIVIYENAWYEATVRSNPLLAGLEAKLEDGVRAVGAQTPAGVRMERTRAFLEFVDEQMSKIMVEWRARETERQAENR